ncbi:hypothetical protein EVAR_58048_1 [Eumeta japonica]|uniref:Uncharacterized protein n=1 Tax=Eumeta variegata TaxID=151549 RepID=A0A4C1Z102_EUMVA|nr:hypothetical protein EVAR_58048_1 [Eumeta japonica]
MGLTLRAVCGRSVSEDIRKDRATKSQSDGDSALVTARPFADRPYPEAVTRPPGGRSPKSPGRVRREPFGVVKRFVFTHCQIGLHQQPTAALNAPIFVRTTIAFEDLYDY